MAAIPNVTLVNPFDPQFQYIQNADLVVTDNGSTGWEGILMKRRVLTLEKNFYEVLPQARKVDDPRILDSAVLAALNEPVQWDDPDYDGSIGCFLDAERATTLDIEAMHTDMSLSISRIDELLAQRRKA